MSGFKFFKNKTDKMLKRNEHFKKLTQDQATEIRGLYKSMSTIKIAVIYNVSQNTINRIVNNKSYVV